MDFQLGVEKVCVGVSRFGVLCFFVTCRGVEKVSCRIRDWHEKVSRTKKVSKQVSRFGVVSRVLFFKGVEKVSAIVGLTQKKRSLYKNVSKLMLEKPSSMAQPPN